MDFSEICCVDARYIEFAKGRVNLMVVICDGEDELRDVMTGVSYIITTSSSRNIVPCSYLVITLIKLNCMKVT
jgi:hypothetical protein